MYGDCRTAWFGFTSSPPKSFHRLLPSHSFFIQDLQNHLLLSPPLVRLHRLPLPYFVVELRHIVYCVIISSVFIPSILIITSVQSFLSSTTHLNIVVSLSTIQVSSFYQRPFWSRSIKSCSIETDSSRDHPFVLVQFVPDLVSYL